MNQFRWPSGLLREPLTRFLLAGAAIFALFAAVRPPEPIDLASKEINIPARQVEVLATEYMRSQGRPPDESMLRALVENHVREEIAYREALAIGLDRNDAVIRRRLQQKFSFLLEDSNATLEPTDEELRLFLDANRHSFAGPDRVSFRQLYIAADDKVAAAQKAADILSALQLGAPPDALGDATTLPQQMLRSTPGSITRTFGDAFIDDLRLAPRQRWSGPIQSSYGLHIVFVTEWTESPDPVLESIRGDVRQALLQQRRRAGVDKKYQELRSRYVVNVAWPASSQGNQ
ncbi:MAG: peptidyl-prolyl cis-trans isomerase [Gammaproteobacteria bacterium]|nr:peptidyl-prolyl cis-trans isomerase [Gammaproteobacteria bacterium]